MVGMVMSWDRAGIGRVGRLVAAALLASAVMLLSGMSNAYAVSFTQTGIKYIFSDQPEDIASTTAKYTIEQALSSYTSYDIDLYHHNQSGSSLRFGVAIKNPNSTTATITVSSGVINTAAWNIPSELAMTSQLDVDYMNGVGAKTVSIPAGGAAWIIYSDVSSGRLVEGKTKFYSNLPVTMRIFHGLTSYTAAQAFGTGVIRDTAASGTTTAHFNYDKRTGTVNADTTTTFYLSDWPQGAHGNTAEYETGTNCLGDCILDGNYGATYEITIQNPRGQRLKITPNWQPDGSNPAAQLTLWSPNYGYWFVTNQLLGSGSWYMAMNNNATFTYRYVLPGSNWGTMKFEVVP